MHIVIGLIAYLSVGGLIGGVLHVLGHRNSVTSSDRARIKGLSGLAVLLWPVCLLILAVGLVLGALQILIMNIIGAEVD